jgi:hypothetical protein
MLSFKQYIEEQEKYTTFGANSFNSKNQMNAIRKLKVFHTYISSPLKKIYVRPDEHFTDTFVMANQDQKFALSVSVSKGGKIFNWTLYSVKNKTKTIIKLWNIDDHKKKEMDDGIRK